MSTTVEEAGLSQEIEAGLAAIQQSESLPDVMSSPQHAMGAMIQSFAAEHARAFGGYNPAAATALEVKFDEHDVAGWFTSLFDWLKQFRKRTLLPASAEVPHLPDDATIALFADWGTDSTARRSSRIQSQSSKTLSRQRGTLATSITQAQKKRNNRD